MNQFCFLHPGIEWSALRSSEPNGEGEGIDMDRVPAIAYLRKDFVKANQAIWEVRMQSLAEELGYTLLKTVAFGATTSRRMELLRYQVMRDKAEAVFVPGLDHLQGEHDSVIALADVVVGKNEVYSRWHPVGKVIAWHWDTFFGAR